MSSDTQKNQEFAQDVQSRMKAFDALKERVQGQFSEQKNELKSHLKKLKHKDFSKAADEVLNKFKELPVERETVLKEIVREMENFYHNEVSDEFIDNCIVNSIVVDVTDTEIQDEELEKKVAHICKNPRIIVETDMHNRISYLILSFMQQQQKEEEIRKLREECSELKSAREQSDKILVEARDSIKRLKADYENLKRRTEREMADVVGNASEDILKKMIPVLDLFDNAMKFYQDKNQEVFEGLGKIYRKFRTILDEGGLKEIEVLGTEFNPEYCDALYQEEGDVESDMVSDVFEKGYMLNEKVIRHARVKVTVPGKGENEK